MTTEERIRKLINKEIASSHNADVLTRLADIRYHRSGYAEPGHTDPTSGIVIFADFGEITVGEGDEETTDYTLTRLLFRLHKLGIETQQITDWAFCDKCGRAVRLVPPRDQDNSFWTPSWFVNDPGNWICRCCVEETPNLYLADAEGRADKMLTFSLPLEELGYVKVQQNFEFSVEHDPQHQPQIVVSALRQQGLRRIILQHIHTGDIELVYAIWIHAGEFDVLRRADSTTLQPNSN